MELSKKERLFLITQYKILALLSKDEESQYFEFINILENGYSILYSQIHDWISEDMPEEDGRHVLEILNLYRAIEDVKRSTKDDRLLRHYYSFFRGFDGNEETVHMSFCRFLIETQGKFREQQAYLLRNDNLNSHAPMIEKYRRMLTASARIESIWRMTADQALAILEA